MKGFAMNFKSFPELSQNLKLLKVSTVADACLDITLCGAKTLEAWKENIDTRLCSKCWAEIARRRRGEL